MSKEAPSVSFGEQVYEVFARKKRGDPLKHVGCVDAPGDALAQVYAWKTYDEENWFEMCVVPRKAIVPAGPGLGPRPQGDGRAPVREDGPSATPGTAGRP